MILVAQRFTKYVTSPSNQRFVYGTKCNLVLREMLSMLELFCFVAYRGSKGICIENSF